MRYETLLFDLDGTLSDPLVGFARSMNYALQAFDFEVRSDAELAPYIGPPLERALAALTGRDEPVWISELVAKYRERYLDIGYRENVLYPDVRDSLQRLIDTGQRLAVCTSKPEPTARMVLDLFGLSDCFEFVSGGGTAIAKWMQIEQLLEDGTISKNALMIGDRSVDIQAGHRNGLASAGVLWGYGSRAELEAESPLQLFDKPADWLNLNH